MTEAKDEFIEIDLKNCNDCHDSVLCCRICHEAEEKEKIIAPCECSGTLGVIHASCLEKWLSMSNSNECEICKSGYFVKRKNRGVIKYLRSGNILQPKHLLIDIICLMVLSILCGVCVYYSQFGIKGARKLTDNVEVFVLIILLILSYTVWLLSLLRYHYTAWKTWSSENQIVKLVQEVDESKNVLLQRVDINAV